MAFVMSTSQAALPTPLTPSMPTCPAPVSEPIPTLPMTPPEPNEDAPPTPDVSAIKLALHVISTERAALEHLENLYQNDAFAKNSLATAVTVIARSCREHGKLVVCGVGKSGKIGAKVVATCNSLGIMATELAPTDALHGDLGLIKPVCRPHVSSLIHNFADNDSERRCLDDHVLWPYTRTQAPPSPYPDQHPSHSPHISSGTINLPTHRHPREQHSATFPNSRARKRLFWLICADHVYHCCISFRRRSVPLSRRNTAHHPW